MVSKKTKLEERLIEKLTYKRAENTLREAFNRDLFSVFGYVVNNKKSGEESNSKYYSKSFSKALAARMSNTYIDAVSDHYNLYLFYGMDEFKNAAHFAIGELKNGIKNSADSRFAEIFYKYIQEDLIFAVACKTRSDLEFEFYNGIIKQRTKFNEIADLNK